MVQVHQKLKREDFTTHKTQNNDKKSSNIILLNNKIQVYDNLG